MVMLFEFQTNLKIYIEATRYLLRKRTRRLVLPLFSTYSVFPSGSIHFIFMISNLHSCIKVLPENTKLNTGPDQLLYKCSNRYNVVLIFFLTTMLYIVKGDLVEYRDLTI